MCQSLFFNKVAANLLTMICSKEKIIITSGICLANIVAYRCSVKKVFCEISQNSQENICARVSFLGMQLYLKKDSDTGVFLRIF